MDSSNINKDNVDLESSDDEISIAEESVQPTGSNINIISKPKRKLAKRSVAWKFFDEVVEGEEPNKIKRAVCKACGLSYVADGKYGTGNMRKHIKEFDDVSSESAPPTKSQLQLYFEDQMLSRFDTVDVLAFWKTNQYRFPIFAVMARDILAVPVSTVASEAAFSVGGCGLDQFRSSLKPDTVEAIICTRDWLFGEKAGGIKNIDDDIDELTQDVVQLSLNEKDSGSNIDNSNEGEESSHAI